MKINYLYPALIVIFLGFGCNTSETKNDNLSEDKLPKPEIVDHEELDGESHEYNVDVNSFLLPNHVILDTLSGDLNLDGIPDIILIQKHVDEEERAYQMDGDDLRPVMLLIGNNDGSYTLAARNDKTVLCRACGGALGEPYAGLAIKNGYFSIEHYGGSTERWLHVVTYKWNKDKRHWFLHKDGMEYMSTLDLDYSEEVIKTTKDFGVVRFEDFDIFE